MISPFSNDRYEYDSNPLYYLPNDLFSSFEVKKPVYVIGSRGSGKTTLLKSLNWKERVRNKSLLRQLSNKPFQGLYIGTYVKLPKFQLGSFSKWLEEENDDIHGKLVGLYLELIFLETISKAVSEMLAENILKISSTEELKCISQLKAISIDILSTGKLDKVESIIGFNQFIKSSRLKLERCALKRMPVNNVLEEFHVSQIGVFSNEIAKKISELCNHDTKEESGEWHFKVCLDEGECLNLFQQSVVNTIVRLSEWPLFPVFSYVSQPKDITKTLIANLSLQKADRNLIIIDSMKRQEFIELAEGVASVRCQEQLDDQEINFKTAVTLGKLDINQLLTNVIKQSESPKTKKIKNDAEQFKKIVEYSGDTLPIYEAYLANELNLPIKKTDRKKERYQESQIYRKKMVAAFLAICNDLNKQNIPYASADMVIGISDGCIRDFLSQINAIFKNRNWNLKKFLTTQIGFEQQRNSIVEASNQKRDSIPESGVLQPVQIGRVVKGLSIITAKIQSSSSDNSHLRSTERGLFYLTNENLNKQTEFDQFINLIRDAADAGFLRIKLNDDNGIETFRVHASLAPSYGFSYRGAYYKVPISIEDFRLLSSTKENDLESVSLSIARKIATDNSDLPLFKNIEDE